MVQFSLSSLGFAQLHLTLRFLLCILLQSYLEMRFPKRSNHHYDRMYEAKVISLNSGTSQRKDPQVIAQQLLSLWNWSEAFAAFLSIVQLNFGVKKNPSGQESVFTLEDSRQFSALLSLEIELTVWYWQTSSSCERPRISRNLQALLCTDYFQYWLLKRVPPGKYY